MKLGLSSYAYGWAVSQGQFDERDLLKHARGFGLSLIQFGDHIPLADFSSARLQRLALTAQNAGIAIEVGARGLTRDNLRRHLNVCDILGARLLRFVIDEGDYEPSAHGVEEIVREWSPALQNGGVTLGIENHDRFPARVLKSIMEAVASHNVGICLDTANSLGAGEGLEAVLQVLAPYTVNLHLKDFAITRVPGLMGFSVEGRPAGVGMMNAPRIISAIEPFGRCSTAVLETWTPPEESMDATLEKERAWAQDSVKYLRGLALFA